MHLIDKQNDIARLFDLFGQSLDAALILSAKLCAGDQCCQIKQLDLFILQTVRHITFCNTQRKSLRDGGFADTRFTDQAGVVFGTAGENLDHTLDLFISADDIIDIALTSLSGQILAVKTDMFTVFPIRLFSFAGFIAVISVVIRFVGVVEHVEEIRERRGAAGGKTVFLIVIFSIIISRIAVGIRGLDSHILSNFGHITHFSHILHNGVHLLLNGLKIIGRDAHLLDDIFYRLDAQLFRAQQTITAGLLIVLVTGYKYNSGAFLTS